MCDFLLECGNQVVKHIKSNHTEFVKEKGGSLSEKLQICLSLKCYLCDLKAITSNISVERYSKQVIEHNVSWRGGTLITSASQEVSE